MCHGVVAAGKPCSGSLPLSLSLSLSTCVMRWVGAGKLWSSLAPVHMSHACYIPSLPYASTAGAPQLLMQQ